MRDRRKQILNFGEQAVADVIRDACHVNDAKIFSKIRIADVLNISGSGLDDSLYSYSLKAHFDHIVCKNNKAEFAIEFDGAGHSRDHDQKKNTICAFFKFPLFRVKQKHLNTSVGETHFLSFMVYQWFCFQWFQKEKLQGKFSYDEPFDLMFFVSVPGKEGVQPLWLGKPYLRKINRLMKEYLPNYMSAYEYGLAHLRTAHLYYSKGMPFKSWRGIAAIEVGSDRFVYALSELDFETFGLSEDISFYITQISTFLDGIVLHDLAVNLVEYFENSESSIVSLKYLQKTVKQWNREGYRLSFGMGSQNIDIWE